MRNVTNTIECLKKCFVMVLDFDNNAYNIYFTKGYILFITKFIGSSPNFNDASPNFEV